MIASKLLSIVIPTYNRADYLDYSLEVHVPLARIYSIEIFISDNASTDNTSIIVEKWKAVYPFIKYYINETNLGPDKNFELALKYPKTEYVWLLGDTHKIPIDGIKYVNELITEKNNRYDVIVFNAGQRVIDIETQDYFDQNKILSDLGWHMTCMSCLIYNTQLIESANFVKFYDSYFIQLGIILDSISKKTFNIHWIKDKSIDSIHLPNKIKDSWQNQTFYIWIEKWSDFILSLPSTYNQVIKLKCIKDHGVKSKIFSFKNLLSLRKANLLNYKNYLTYYQLLPLTINYSNQLILIIAILPINALNILNIFKKIKTINHNNETHLKT